MQAHTEAFRPQVDKIEYWRDQTAATHQYMRLLSVLVLVLEVLMLAVYLFSRTPEFPALERGYPAFYLSGAGLSVLYLLLAPVVHRRRRVLQWSYYLLLVAWSSLLAAYDTVHGNGCYALAQVLVFASVGCRFPPVRQCAANLGGYLLFAVFLLLGQMPQRMLYAQLINALIFAVLACAIVVYHSRQQYRNHLDSLTIAAQTERLQYLASFDSLTGIPNRRTILEYLQKQLDAGTSPCCALLDIDDFKRYNDTYGHPAGDECLRRVAQLLQRFISERHGMAGRYGGEEFFLVFDSLPYPELCRLMEALFALLAHDGDTPWTERDPITLSAGIYPCGEQDTVDTAVCRADQALYRVKHSGKNNYFIVEK